MKTICAGESHILPTMIINNVKEKFVLSADRVSGAGMAAEGDGPNVA